VLKANHHFADYHWSEAELAQVEAFAHWEPQSPQAPGIGHNGPPNDPGPDRTYQIGFRVPEYVPRDRVQAFEHILQEQGAYGGRLAALDQAAYRVRASSTVTARAYRVYDAILDASRGGHRCCLLDQDKIAHLAGVHDRSVASKVIEELEVAGHIAALRFTEGPFGEPTAKRVFVAPIVAAEDRAGTTLERVYTEADAAKMAALQKRAEDARKRYRRKVASDIASGEREPLVDATSTRLSSCHSVNEKGFLVDRTGLSSGRHGTSVYQRDTIAEERGPADAGAPPSQCDHVVGTLSVATSPPIQPNGSGSGVPPRQPPARVTRPTKAKVAAAEVQAALDLYNAAAKAHSWTVCTTLTSPRAKRLEGRLRDIGGIEAFKQALSAIPRDDFLMGRRPPRSGERPFKLDLESLLQTDGKMGDVLAKLIDRAGEAVPATSGRPGQGAVLPSDRCRQILENYPIRDMRDWQRDIHGPLPNEPGCLFPPDLIRELGLTGAST